jgi:DNA topoisomerase-3
MMLTKDRHILSAARRLVALDEKQVDAVSARIELDLRIGYAFTRFLTLNLRPLGGPLSQLTLSYGKPGLYHQPRETA